MALDVGRGQLDWKLRNDPRVTVVEGVNVRYLDPDLVPGPFDLIVVDVSFISLRLVLPVLFPLLRDRTVPDAPESPPQLPMLFALLKPQFEVGRGQVGKGGIVTDASEHERVLLEISSAARLMPGCPGLQRIVESPIRGAEGNREFFLCFRAGPCLEGGAIEEEVRRVVSGPSPGGASRKPGNQG